MKNLWHVLTLAMVCVAACSTPTETFGAAATAAPAAPSSSPAMAVRATGEVPIVYEDVAGRPRTIQVEIRLPGSATGPVPVVIWSHGGSSGKRSTARVGVEWGQALSDRGFAFVAIAHVGRSLDERATLCEALRIEDCGQFMYLDWDRPADVGAVLAWLDGLAYPALDLSRLVYGGHSAGARSVLRVAGAEMRIPGAVQPPPIERFAAFLVMSPPGRDQLGLNEASLAPIDRPVFTASGVGDTTDGNQALDRLATMEVMPAATTTAIWVDDLHTPHTTFDLNATSCERVGGTRQRCTEIVRGLGITAARFISAVFEGQSETMFERAASDRLPDGFSIVG